MPKTNSRLGGGWGLQKRWVAQNKKQACEENREKRDNKELSKDIWTLNIVGHQ